MKQMLKAAWIALRSACATTIYLAAIAFVMFDFLNRMVDNMSLSDLLQDLIDYKVLYFILALSLYVFLFRFTTSFFTSLKKTRLHFALALLIGEAVVMFGGAVFWNHVEAVCFSEVFFSPMSAAYEVSFGTFSAGKLYILLNVGFLYCLTVLFVYSELFFRDAVISVAVHQAFSDSRMLKTQMDHIFPLVLFFLGQNSLIYFFHFRLGAITTLACLFTNAVLIAFRVRTFRALLRYERVALRENGKNRVMVRFIEEEDGPSQLCRLLLNHRDQFLSWMEAGIAVLPERLFPDGVRGSICVIPPEHALGRAGTFQIIYAPESTRFQAPQCCDLVAYMPRELFAGIQKYAVMLENQLKQWDLADSVRTNRCKSDSMSKEIIFFKEYLMRQKDVFYVFDYCIKWLEIVNYFFALSVISEKRVPVTPAAAKRIDSATFADWRAFRQELSRSTAWEAQLLQPCEELEPFQCFQYVWTAMTSRAYQFQAYTLEELLEASNLLRDYTRGHGVFTFEISQELNLSVLGLLTYLLNAFLTLRMADGPYENLEALGWIVTRDGSNYFLYSYNKEFHEFIYNSFRYKNSILLPDRF